MERNTIAIVAVALMLALAGCAAGGTSDEQQATAENSLENNTHTFTKPAAGVDGYWTCIGHEKFTGSAGDEQLECELVTE